MGFNRYKWQKILFYSSILFKLDCAGIFRSSLREIIIQFINQFFQKLSDKEYLNYLKDDFSNYETFLDILSKKYEIGSLSYVDYFEI